MSKAFKLSDLITPILPLWGLAWLLGLVTAISVIGLLVVSGYFLTMAGLTAGVGAFNYLAMSGAIRNFAIARTVGRYGDLMVSHNAIFELLRQLRVKFFGQFAKLPMSDRQKIGSATAQYRLVKDIDTLDEFPLKVVSPFVVVGLVLVLAGVAVAVIGSFGSFLILPLVVVGNFMATAKKFAKQATDLQEKRQTRLVTALPALTQLTLWHKWQAVADDVAKLDNELSQINARQSRHNTLAVLVVQGILIAVLCAVLAVGAIKLADNLSVAVLLAVVLGFLGLMEVANSLTADVGAFVKANLAKDRLNAILGADNTPMLTPMPDKFNIKINHLSAYQTGAIFGLDDVNATIRQGVPLVISGISGGGKSTLLQTLAGEIAPKAGEIVIETDSKNYPMNGIDWQNKFGFLGQQVDIFDQSLADNLRLGKQGASDDELWAVLDLVGLADWTKSQPQGLATPLGEYGTAVSGGQARRIALARLLLSPKKLLLLDEPFAGLDSTSREKLWENLKARQKNGVLVVVSHHELSGEFERLVVKRG